MTQNEKRSAAKDSYGRRTARPGMVRALPVFRGWTVDERLREFRMMQREVGFVILPFDSADGQELLAAYLASRD